MSKIIKGKDAKEWFNEGLKHCEHENFQRAIECFKKSLKIDPQNRDTWLELYGIYIMHKSFPCPTNLIFFIPSRFGTNRITIKTHTTEEHSI